MRGGLNISAFWQRKILLFLILSTVFLCFSPAVENNFLNWDDNTHIFANPSVLNLDGAHLKKIFTTTVNKTYIPLTIFSFALEHHYFGFNPRVYHFNNLILHLFVIVLVFFFARQIGLTAHAAALAALLFGIHPMHVESVAWATERKDVLYASFYMLALCCYWQYLHHENKFPYILTVIFGLFSLLAKPMAATLPLLFFVCDWFKGRRFSRKVILDKILFFLFIIPLAGITYSANPDVISIHSDLTQAVLIFIWTFVFYIQKFIWPDPLIPSYMLPEPITILNWPYLSSLLIFGFMVIFFVLLRRNRLFIFACLFYIVTISIVLRHDVKADFHWVADRFMYVPSIGICFYFGNLCEGFLRILDRHAVWLKRLAIFCLIILFLGLSRQTLTQCKIWKNSETLWTAILKEYTSVEYQYPILAQGYNNRGLYYDGQGFSQLALADFSRGERIDPQHWKIYNNRGAVYIKQGLLDLALKEFEKALEIAPSMAEIYYNRGIAYEKNNRLDLAIADYTEAIRIDGDYQEAHNNRGVCHSKQGHNDLALADFKIALELNPNFAEAYSNRGLVYKNKGEYHLALVDFRKAISLNPYSADYYFNRGIIYQIEKQYTQAIVDYTKALQINPEYADVYNNRGNIYNDQGYFDLALDDFNKVIEMDDHHVDAYNNRGIIYAKKKQYDLAMANYHKALELNPNYASAYYNRSLLYRQIGEYQKALEDVLKAKALGYNVAEEHIQLIEKNIRKEGD